MKRKIVISIILVAVVAMISGATILTLAAGSQTDPLVTLSYLNDIFKPKVMEDAGKIGRDMEEKFDARIDELEAELQSGQGSTPTAPNAADRFTVVTLSRGQSLTCSVGAEIMLRIGTATGFGSEPALVNYTTGESLSSGASLTVNHMYLVTIEGNGLRATADLVRVLVRGSYKIT